MQGIGGEFLTEFLDVTLMAHIHSILGISVMTHEELLQYLLYTALSEQSLKRFLVFPMGVFGFVF